MLRGNHFYKDLSEFNLENLRFLPQSSEHLTHLVILSFWNSFSHTFLWSSAYIPDQFLTSLDMSSFFNWSLKLECLRFQSLVSSFLIFTSWMSSPNSITLNIIHMLRTQKCLSVFLIIIPVYPFSYKMSLCGCLLGSIEYILSLFYGSVIESVLQRCIIFYFKLQTVTLIRNLLYSWLHCKKVFLQRQLLQALQLSLTLINTRHFAN
jgi:hypothetical protein